MNRSSVIFCVLSLLASGAICAVGYSLAAMPRAAVSAARTPMPAERMGEIDLGRDFGRVSVLDLVSYYVEHPPASAAAGAPRPRRFGGC